MSFQITALAAEQFNHLFDLSSEQLRSHNACRLTVKQANSMPCRVSLQDAAVGDTVLLLNHQHLPHDTPFQAAHAIFVRQGVRQAQLEKGELPKMISKRLIAVRAFDADHMMLNADVAQGEVLSKLITAMLQLDDVAYLHLHFAKQGCYVAKAVACRPLS